MLFEELTAFVAVIDHNSLSRAAVALSLTQSAVSRRMQHLEEVLGAELFDRNSRPPVPTALARRVYAQAVPLMQATRRLLDIARDDAVPTGAFRLGLTPVVGEVVLFDVVTRMRAAFPTLEVKLQTDWRSSLQRQLAQGTLDAAALMLASPSAAPTGLSGRFIDTLDVVVVQSRQRPLVARQAGMAELAGHEWILNPSGCGYRAALEHAMGALGRTFRLGLDTHGTALQLQLVGAGLGLGLVPRSVLQGSASRAELAVVEVADFSLKLDIWVVHSPQMGNLQRAADLLGDAIEGSFSRLARSPA
jgi:DNA-binding transcriptional LysR family regulator